MKVQFTRQAYPQGGGHVMPAGKILDLPAKVLKQYPRDSYRQVRRKQTAAPADKQMTGGANKGASKGASKRASK